ncbi:MAG: alpha/beta hydrolase [Prolixibacteraceae bacterium]|nr:alpha/beta hydrolase [Prolixibacteraceae bacterium]MBT6004325.1 alpha/beta hydrolase [Prolixibacteraceae bacterium]MBT6766443.1 alpha/beta hydrolase [Prolixibacteraceae bacterium]MBT6997704.1 alpha/beta hydrolase [Prolixibacteraceae bacterium]MBT7396596.1 alpha/beta hydrolase [Prolixibacteraceae bacterium]
MFVHGAGGSNVVWFRQLREFKKHFNVLLVDLRGHGKSKEKYTKEEIYKFDEIALDVIHTMDHLKIKKAHFVGISLGCIIIRAMDKLAPGRAESIILGGAIIQFNVKIKALVSVGKLLSSILPYMWIYRINAWILIPSKKHVQSRNLFIKEAMRLGEREFKKWLKMTTEIKGNLQEFIVKEASVPVLYLMGERDHMFLPMVTNLVKKHFNSQLGVIQNSGHVCNLDQPEEFNERSIQFIKSISG